MFSCQKLNLIDFNMVTSNFKTLLCWLVLTSWVYISGFHRTWASECHYALSYMTYGMTRVKILFSSSVSLGTCSRKVIVVAKCQSHTPVLLAHHTGILLLIPYYCCKFTTSFSPTISNTHKLVYTFFF